MKRKFLYSEAKLAEVTGLSRAQLKTCRIQGEYRHGQGKGAAIELSHKGVEKVLEKFGIQDTDLDGARLFSTDGTRRSLHQDQSATLPEIQLTSDGRVANKNELVEAIYAGLHAVPDLKLVKVSQLVPNKRILRAVNGTGEIYNVIVPSSEVWALQDPMRIKPSQTHQGYWQLVGKAPRWRGDKIYRHEFV